MVTTTDFVGGELQPDLALLHQEDVDLKAVSVGSLDPAGEGTELYGAESYCYTVFTFQTGMFWPADHPTTHKMQVWGCHSLASVQEVMQGHLIQGAEWSGGMFVRQNMV